MPFQDVNNVLYNVIADKFGLKTSSFILFQPGNPVNDTEELWNQGFAAGRNRKLEEERSPKRLKGVEHGRSGPKKPHQKRKKERGGFCSSGFTVMLPRSARTNRRADVCSASQNTRKSMSAQLFGLWYDLFLLLAIPTSCSYQPQTPERREKYRNMEYH